LNWTRAIRGSAICVVAASLVMSASAHTFDPRAGNHVIADPVSGMALFGYDPVVYFAEAQARTGRAEFSLEHENRIWRFHTAANRAAFAEHPEAYVPRFGGHDGLAVAEGRMIFGDPKYFVVSGGEVVLFRSAENRDRFAADVEIRRAALSKWAGVVRQFAGH
jgi:YHS domain-containing protein